MINIYITLGTFLFSLIYIFIGPSIYKIPRVVLGPIFSTIIILVLTQSSISDLVLVIGSKYQIVLLILSFAFMANSLDESGFFEFCSFKIVKYANGNGTRLIIFFYLMTSTLTYFTSNDIVILSVTPILLYVGRHADIKDMVPYLIIQFVAANTLSMGLYIGSPTNIVIADAMGINFLTYFIWMFLPTFTAGCITIIILYIVFVSHPILGHKVILNYRVPEKAFTVRSSKEMMIKVIGFSLCLIIFTFSDYLAIQIWEISSIFGFMFLLLDLSIFRNKPKIGKSNDDPEVEKIISVFQKFKHMFSRIPFVIVPFVFGYFFMVFNLTSFGITQFIADKLDVILHFSLLKIGLFFGFFSALIVNIMNDIPSTVFLADMISTMNIESPLVSQVVILSSLVGSNVGCYVTFIGALAGIMWFKILSDNSGIKTILPTKLIFTLYGLLFAPIVILGSVVVVVLQVIAFW